MRGKFSCPSTSSHTNPHSSCWLPPQVVSPGKLTHMSGKSQQTNREEILICKKKKAFWLVVPIGIDAIDAIDASVEFLDYFLCFLGFPSHFLFLHKGEGSTCSLPFLPFPAAGSTTDKEYFIKLAVWLVVTAWIAVAMDYLTNFNAFWDFFFIFLLFVWNKAEWDTCLSYCFPNSQKKSTHICLK